MLVVTKINQFFSYSGVENFALNSLPLEIKNKISSIQTDSTSGNSLLYWRPGKTSNLDFLQNGKTYYILSNISGFSSYSIAIDADLPNQNGYISKIYQFITYRTSANFNLNNLNQSIKNKISAVYLESISGLSLLLWSPANSSFNSILQKDKTYLLNH